MKAFSYRGAQTLLATLAIGAWLDLAMGLDLLSLPQLPVPLVAGILMRLVLSFLSPLCISEQMRSVLA
jgi:hypothetical protein